MQLAGAGETSQSLGVLAGIARSMRFDNLAPRGGRGRQVAAQLGALAESVEGRDPLPLRLPFGPQLERALGQHCRVAVGVHGTRGIECEQERRASSLRLPTSQPVLGKHCRRGATLRQSLSQLSMQRAAPRPGDVGVERVPYQRMVERGFASLYLDQQPQAEGLAKRVLTASEWRDEIQVEAHPGHGGDLDGGAASLAQAGRAE